MWSKLLEERCIMFNSRKAVLSLALVAALASAGAIVGTATAQKPASAGTQAKTDPAMQNAARLLSLMDPDKDGTVSKKSGCISWKPNSIASKKIKTAPSTSRN